METLTESQTNQLKRLKSYFPYRIIFGVIDKDTNEFTTWAKTTKHVMNRLARAGHKVFLIN